MSEIKDSFFNLVSNLKGIVDSYGLTWKESFLKWSVPDDVDADFAIAASLPISHFLKRNSLEVADEIKNKLLSSDIEMSVVKPGYINCKFKSDFYKCFLNSLLINGFFNFRKVDKIINVEFVSVNPTGYLHFGHLRNAIIGDSIARIYESMGYKVIREYYINDRGNQIKELVKSVLSYYFKIKGIDCAFKEDDITYKGSASIDAATYFADNNIFSLDDIRNNDSSFVEDKIIEFFINKIRSDLLLCGVEFNSWFSEKAMYGNEDLLEETLNNFKRRNFSYLKDNALFLKTSLMGDDKDRVIIKENGDYTYFLSDIIYHINKINRSDLLVNVWGSDHHGYIGRLIGTLDFLGYKASEKLSIILIQMVSLLTDHGSKKFSKRLGNVISVDEVFEIIDRDQLRFCLLEKEAGHAFFVNLEMLNLQRKNSRLYYIQYAHARCNQLINKWLEVNKSIKNIDNLLFEGEFLLNEKSEREILVSLLGFSRIVMESAEQKKPFIIINYLQNLSKSFQSYYQSYQIIKKNSYELSYQRILFVKLVKETIKTGLNLCGISAPEFMESSEESSDNFSNNHA